MRRLLFLSLLAVMLSVPAAAQQPELRREMPDVGWTGCTVASNASVHRDIPEDRRREAERLASNATQSAILGDSRAAADLLATAAEIDPTSASIAYRNARALEELGRDDAALFEYCRYLALAPDSPDAADVQARTRALSGSSARAVSVTAARAWERALASYDRGRLEDAERDFGVAMETEPDWPDPVLNRGLVRLRMNRAAEAAADLRRFIEMSPGAPEFDAVLDIITTLRGGAPARATQRYDPGSVLAAGLVLPGLGHFRTDRPVAGAAWLASAAAVVLTGALVTRTDIECLSPPVDGRCPPEQVVGENVERPLLMPSLAAALGIGIVGAFDAWRGARRLNAQSPPDAADRAPATGASVHTGIRLAHPNRYSAAGGARIELLRIRF